MALSDYIKTFGQHLLGQHGERIHKIALDAGFTCPNRDGAKGIGGCTFCNNNSFNPNGQKAQSLEAQLDSGRRAIAKRTRAKKYLAYFQAYTNTYADVAELDADRKSTRLNSSHTCISYAGFCLKKKKTRGRRSVWVHYHVSKGVPQRYISTR